MFRENYGILAISGLVLVLFVVSFLTPMNFFWEKILENKDTYQLPYFILRTLLRMMAAYILALVFAYVYGTVAGIYRLPRMVMVPFLDIMQSIPILGYLPAFVLLFTNVFQGELGIEMAAILLIFTSEVWAITYNVYGAVRNIPNDLREASKAFGLQGLQYIRHVVLPATFQPVVTGSVLAWGGGWYFLVAAEFIVYGSRHYELPGLGSYLAKSVFVYGNVYSALFGLVILAGIVYTINRLVWQPLAAYSERFKVKSLKTETVDEENGSLMVRFLEFIRRTKNSLDYVWDEKKVMIAPLINFLNLSWIYTPRKKMPFQQPMMFRIPFYTFLFIFVMILFGLFVAISLEKPLVDLKEAMDRHKEVYNLPFYTISSLIRIFVAYVIALILALTFGLLITRNKFLSGIFMPFFDIAQSIPALALFPFIIVFVINFLGEGWLSVEIATILLLLTGSLWYLLFNVVGAIRRIPDDVIEASKAYGLKDLTLIRHLYLPAIVPGVLLGSIQAIGGAWNALIVSEYITYGGKVYSVNGLGSLLNMATIVWGEPTLVALVVSTMALTVILTNLFGWRYLFRKAEKYKFE
ncbi:ABC transporter permease subunit [Candidatus Micrarchaeota archaeon]|nr:ABC transporter permease subunit [Candidatus Micrarchaeota archaeon]